jgi:YidC/Oxa1 family membrane protein insertase
MDKKGIFAIVCAIGVLIWWQMDYSKKMEVYRAAKATAPQVEGSESKVMDSSKMAQASSTAAAPPANQASEVASVEEKTAVLKGSEAEWLFSSKGGGIRRITLAGHSMEPRGVEPVVMNRFGNSLIGATGETFEGSGRDHFEMVARPDAGVVEFRRAVTQGGKLSKVFRTSFDGRHDYVVRLDISIDNDSGKDVAYPALTVRLGGEAAIHGTDQPLFTGFGHLKDKSVSVKDVNWFVSSGFLGFGKEERTMYREIGKVGWGSVYNQYFTTTGTVLGGDASEFVAMRHAVSEDAWKGVAGSGSLPNAVEGAVVLDVGTVAAGQKWQRTIDLYSGPKEHERLKTLGREQEEVMQFGWFGAVSRMLLWSMNRLHDLLGSYPLAIVVLTILIKAALWPVQNRATASMKRMQEIQPKVTALREKYGDNPQRMNQEMLGLYKKHGVNPFSGCLPMLIQIPIFLGFYGMLGKAVELRNVGFLWVSDLSQPDTVATVLGIAINVLPILMAVTMFWQMAISPKSGDPMQQKIFMFMPLMFIYFCYSFASALSLYWTVQNLFSIVQLYASRRNASSGDAVVLSESKKK